MVDILLVPTRYDSKKKEKKPFNMGFSTKKDDMPIPKM